jgi:hypothetical protein
MTLVKYKMCAGVNVAITSFAICVTQSLAGVTGEPRPIAAVGATGTRLWRWRFTAAITAMINLDRSSLTMDSGTPYEYIVELTMSTSCHFEDKSVCAHQR